MFITLEGIEGAGKGTLLRGLCAWLEKTAHPYIVTREPGGSRLGQVLRAELLDVRHHIVPEAELFLYLADRAQHVHEVIRPALAAGNIVISDRYADSTIVYQGYGRGLDVEELVRLNERATQGLWPHLTLLLDAPAAVGLERARKRNARKGMATTEGRFEAEALAFHERVQQGYVRFAARNPTRFALLDATQAPEKVLEEAIAVVEQRLKPSCNAQIR